MDEKEIAALKDSYFSILSKNDDYEIDFWKKNKARVLAANADSFISTRIPKRATERIEEIKRSGTSDLEIKATCLTSMWAFAKTYFPHYLKKPSCDFHKFLYKILAESVNNGLSNKWAIAAPRSSSKSSILSTIFPLWCIVFEKTKFLVIVSDTAGKASDFLDDIKSELELNEALNVHYPYACGKGATWTKEEIVTKNRIKIRSLGVGNKIRGRKFGQYRPSVVICHERGTKLLCDGKFIPIEEHPTARSFIGDSGKEVLLWGVPFKEVVTNEHLYWTRKVLIKHGSRKQARLTPPQWKRVDEIRHDEYIGYPIDNEIKNHFPKLEKYSGSNSIRKRKRNGQIEGDIKGIYSYCDFEEFRNPEFWWFVGLWWGDGHIGDRHMVGISINNNDIITTNRLISFIETNLNRRYHIIQKPGCVQVTFCHTVLRNWLKSWRYGNSIKIPPSWIETLPLEYQKELVRGYIDADGFIDYKNEQIRITSVCLEGLLCLRRLLSRFGIPSYVRNGIDGKMTEIKGHRCKTQKKYDLMFRSGANTLGYDIPNPSRYTFNRVFIQDGYIWSKIKEIRDVKREITFSPITTPTSSYITHFGLSHNCDDVEDMEMVKSDVQRDFIKNEWFNKDVLFIGGKGDRDPLNIFFVGTILGKDSLLNTVLDSKEYPGWNTRRFQAVEEFSMNPLWDDWANIYRNPFDVNRVSTAKKFFEQHREEMLEGTKVLWPEGIPYYDAMEVMVTDESAFSSEYQNASVDYTKVMIRKDDIHFESFNDPKIRDMLNRCLFFGGIDPSLGKKSTTGDPSAICVLGRDPLSGLIFVMELDSRRRPIEKQIDDILSFHDKYHFRMFNFETIAFQYVVAELLRKKSRESGAYLPVKDTTYREDKKLRFEGVVPFIKDGTIIFDREKYSSNRIYRSGVDEILSFTGENDRQDDVPDSIVLAFDVAKKPRFRLLTKENKKEY